MTTYALEGQGASIDFGTSGFSADLITLTMPEQTRATLETTHLGTTGAKTSKPAKLKEVGEITAEFDHNPAEVNLIETAPEQITISYPLLPGQTTPTMLQFTGFATKQGGQEFKTDAKMMTKVSIKVDGDIEVIPAT